MRVIRVLVAVVLAVSAVSVRFSAQTVNTASFVAGEILVKFRPGTPASARAEAHRQAQGIVLNEISRRGVVLVGIPGGDESAAISRYRRNPNVLYAEPNFIRRIPMLVSHTPGSEVLPADYYFDEQWALHNTGQLFYCIPWIDGELVLVCRRSVADSDAPEAWAIRAIGRSPAATASRRSTPAWRPTIIPTLTGESTPVGLRLHLATMSQPRSPRSRPLGRLLQEPSMPRMNTLAGGVAAEGKRTSRRLSGRRIRADKVCDLPYRYVHRFRRSAALSVAARTLTRVVAPSGLQRLSLGNERRDAVVSGLCQAQLIPEGFQLLAPGEGRASSCDARMPYDSDTALRQRRSSSDHVSRGMPTVLPTDASSPSARLLRRRRRRAAHAPHFGRGLRPGHGGEYRRCARATAWGSGDERDRTCR